MKLRLCLALLALSPLPAVAQQLKVSSEKAVPIYDVGEPVVWSLSVTGDGADAVKEVDYTVKRDAGTVVSSGKLAVENGAARLESKLDIPGTLIGTFSFDKADATKTQASIGAAIAPFKIQPSMEEPADFGSFWKAKVAELDQVAQNPVLTSEPSGIDGVDYSKLTLDNIRGSHVQAQIARPTAGKKFPALIRYQYAGVYGLPKTNVTNYAKGGWLCLNVNAHDLPLDQPKEFYDAQAGGPLKNYPSIGDSDRDQSYFLRMVLGTVRAIEYIKTRPDWDGKTIVVEGTSQGGMQALMAGGLSPDVTAVIVNVPAGNDNTGPSIGRAAPWPYWWSRAKANPAVMETSRFYDAANFARHIKAPTLVAVGLLDLTAIAPTVMAAFNQVQGSPKKLVIMPFSDHQGHGGTQADFYKWSGLWLKALANGEAPPVN